MATNRFRQIIPVRSNYVPQVYTPDFSAMATVLGQQQQAYDQALAVGEKVPQHLQTPEERAALENYMSGVRGSIDELSRIYADEGVNAGNRKRKELLRTVGRDWQPGGTADRFQKRLETVQAARKSIDEMYKDDPRVADYYKRQISISPFEESENANNYGIGTPTTDKIYSTEELGNYYDKVLGNIEADQIVQAPYLDRNTLRGMSFKDLLVSGKTKYIDWNKAAQVLAGATTQDILQSERVKGQAYGLEGDQGRILATDDSGQAVLRDRQGRLVIPDEEGNMIVADDSGNPLLDSEGNTIPAQSARMQFADTNLGRMLQGYTTGKAYEQQDLDNKVITDDWGMWNAQQRIKRQQELQNVAVLTQPFNRSRGIFSKAVEISDGGKALTLKGSKADAEARVREGIKNIEGYSMAGIGGMVISAFRGMFGEDDKITLDSPQIQNTVKVLEDRGMFVKEDGEGNIIPMSEEEKLNTLGNYLNNRLERLPTQAMITPILDDRVIKNWNQVFFNGLDNADADTQGLISNLKVYSQEDSDNPMSGTELLNKAASENTMPRIEAEVTQPQSLLPYGTRTFQVGDKEYRAEPLESDKQKPEYALNMMYRAAQNDLNNFSVEEDLPPMAPIYIRPDGVQVPNGLAQYVDRRGKYKLEYTTEGYNIYRREGSEYKQLNDTPFNLE